MSKVLEARIDRLEAIIIGLMDEIVEMKLLRDEIRTNHVNQQIKAQQQINIEIQKQQLAAQAANISANSLYGLAQSQAAQASVLTPEKLSQGLSAQFNKLLGGL